MERLCAVNVLVLLGSLRDGSSSRRLTEAATADLGEDVAVEISELPRLLPHYDQDLDRPRPSRSRSTPSVRRWRRPTPCLW
nr:NAD(P)H-dependent oxidoreductase [Piscicoccus intestinalis]